LIKKLNSISALPLNKNSPAIIEGRGSRRGAAQAGKFWKCITAFSEQAAIGYYQFKIIFKGSRGCE